MEENMQDIADRTLEVLDERGWFQGGLIHSSEGSVCIFGALHIATGSEAHYRGHYCIGKKNADGTWLSVWTEAGVEMSKRYTTAIKALFPGRPSHPANFNDDPLTTLEDVKLVIKRAGEMDE